MTNFVLIADGVVVQKQPYSQEGFVEAPDDVVCGMLSDGKVFSPPELPSPVITPPQPLLYAAVAVSIAAGSITVIEQAAQLVAATYDAGWLMIVFAEPQDTTNYLIFAQTDVPAKIEQFKSNGYFELVFSNASTGAPIEPGRIDIQILKVR